MLFGYVLQNEAIDEDVVKQALLLAIRNWSESTEQE